MKYLTDVLLLSCLGIGLAAVTIIDLSKKAPDVIDSLEVTLISIDADAQLKSDLRLAVIG